MAWACEMSEAKPSPHQLATTQRKVTVILVRITASKSACGRGMFYKRTQGEHICEMRLREALAGVAVAVVAAVGYPRAGCQRWRPLMRALQMEPYLHLFRFILDSIRVLAGTPSTKRAPNVLGVPTKTHLKSRYCAISDGRVRDGDGMV